MLRLRLYYTLFYKEFVKIPDFKSNTLEDYIYINKKLNQKL